MEKLYQTDIIDWIKNSWGNEIMVPVYGGKKEGEYDIFIQSYLIAIENAEEQLNTDAYEIEGELQPGLIQNGKLTEENVIYRRFNNEISAEPLVIERDFMGLKKDDIEIAEEFRLLFNLYFNTAQRKYIDLENDIEVVNAPENGFVEIHKKYLKSYLAVKKMVLVMCIDSRYNCPQFEPDVEEDSIEYRSEDRLLFYTLTVKNNNWKNCHESVLFGKKLVYGCDLKDCGIWPFEKEKEYNEFIIGPDENGDAIEHTSNPSVLNNLYNVHPNAPSYFTPVYFDIAVLERYYSNPEVYSVDEESITCGRLWSIPIGKNSQEGYVLAYLGDLGKMLPNKQEQDYWKSFNKLIKGKPSKAKINRDFFSIPSEPETVDQIFKNTYIRVNKKFDEKLGWKLFLDLDEKDAYIFDVLRIPIYETITEFDTMVLYLTKIIIDSLNEQAILSQLPEEQKNIRGSINRLCLWMKNLGLEDYNRHIDFLKKLQELRSSGSGHRKGDNYKKISKIFNIAKENYREDFAEILKYATDFLCYIEQNINIISANVHL